MTTSIACSKCGKEFNKSNGLRAHVTFFHREEGQSERQAIIASSLQSQKSVDTPEDVVLPIKQSKQSKQSRKEKKAKSDSLLTPSKTTQISINKEESFMNQNEIQEAIKPLLAEAFSDMFKAKQEKDAVEAKQQQAAQVEQKKAEQVTDTMANLSTTLEGLTDSIKTITDKSTVFETLVPKIDNMVQSQQVTEEDLRQLKNNLPENFCTSYPDLCQRMGAMETAFTNNQKNGASIKESTQHAVKKAYGCPNCKKAYLSEAKEHISDIIGEDDDLLIELAEKRGLVVSRPPQEEPKPQKKRSILG